jgi:hypothetical protein
MQWVRGVEREVHRVRHRPAAGAPACSRSHSATRSRTSGVV